MAGRGRGAGQVQPAWITNPSLYTGNSTIPIIPERGIASLHGSGDMQQGKHDYNDDDDNDSSGDNEDDDDDDEDDDDDDDNDNGNEREMGLQRMSTSKQEQKQEQEQEKKKRRYDKIPKIQVRLSRAT